MKKNFIYASMLAIAACASGSMLTSCNDDSDVVNETSTTTTVANQCNDAFVSLPTGQNGQKIAVRFEGTRAAVTTDVQGIGSTALNADVTFTDDCSGVIKMDGDTFQKKEIPFMKSSSALALDFTKSSDFDGNTVILTKGTNETTCTRALIEDGKFCSDDIITPEAQKMVSNFTQALLKVGFKSFFGDIGGGLADPILGYVFGKSDPNVAQFEALQKNLDKMDQRIAGISDKIDQKDVAQAYRDHWSEINNLKTLNLLTYEAIAKHPEQKQEKLEKFSNSVINGYTLYSGLVNILKKYSVNYDATRTWYDVLDEFAFDAFPFEDLGYGDRELTRAMDLKVLTDAANLMNEYYKISDQSQGTQVLEDALTQYYEYANAHQVKRDSTHVICQIPDAYLVMEKEAKHKTVGEGAYNSSDKGYELNPHAHDEEERNGSWILSYVYSDKGIGARKQEIKAMCLTEKQAKAIVEYCNKRFGGNYTLGQILQGEGITGLKSVTKGQILLADKCYADWYDYKCGIFKDHSHAYINCSVWDNEKNEYNSDFTIDDIEFNNHNNRSGLSLYVSYELGKHNPDQNLDYVIVDQSWSDRSKAVAKEGYNSEIKKENQESIFKVPKNIWNTKISK